MGLCTWLLTENITDHRTDRIILDLQLNNGLLLFTADGRGMYELLSEAGMDAGKGLV